MSTRRILSWSKPKGGPNPIAVKNTYLQYLPSSEDYRTKNNIYLNVKKGRKLIAPNTLAHNGGQSILPFVLNTCEAGPRVYRADEAKRKSW